MIVLDTHAWIWWVSSPAFLSKTAKGIIDRAVTERNIFISAISTWEVAILVTRGRAETDYERRRLGCRL
jgi:PIN domain nuclease of toxin-antitoxin system